MGGEGAGVASDGEKGVDNEFHSSQNMETSEIEYKPPVSQNSVRYVIMV